MNIIFTGGGTGGHLVIALSLAETARERGHRVIFIGSASGQDRQWFGDSDLFEDTYFLDTTGVVNKKGLGKLNALWKIFKALLVSRSIIRDFHADAIVSVGGFSAASAAIAALTTKTPLFIHEQNAITGKLNKLLRPYAKGFFSSYEEGDNHCDYPVNPRYFQNARLRDAVKTVIFLGGSQGAKFINDLALEIAPWLNEGKIHIIHQCGLKEEERVKKGYADLGIDAEVYGFTTKIAELVERSDFAISRSGASTLWELCAAGVPAFYIPFPYAAADHQFHNARYIIDHDAGWCERQGDGLAQKLQEAILSDIRPKSEMLRHLIAPEGAVEIIEKIEERI
ncbi:MAG: UDP-N-acetylglucosamine--N-acetylmuramyl-(pentapeptide) pyrophosphoryl-undecaprenol N-acetylglucosamine transferase [Sulfuricurvum sp.]|uniref:UDP-N-acetylglucosamine--N-acetylmuramyl- (pentapeptide) pyrophosphoryl-undecaprenol N-acetylglucosamine transferase n=1 Tax=Sulfuricurvum sp. TaxID=2025608 RepID=UPI002637E36B|nr:UDP-N-acetylglucosamine--N-acetylmuramyl-(pentapeptide) pyrophosphoryl-undecaprenol N-acetylglucosamine transferase [Sulfuricurvum sp.]MDD3595871.1 UDP-N-acetylglucosamine--N-acetylmuramyl-(pentapeptide) pyrophosphoryl-undecaprenol N-acetylglucosamine transferase [Sulfuricurvum sp.]